jgi:glycine cleavage system H protein|tara:strand:- start:2151 stop:2534 length:384 start_codon:yes stop_codon:yes gene_type:complete
MTDLEKLKYATTHEWVRLEESGELMVGISEHAQNLLGDVVFVEFPELGKYIKGNEGCMLLESVKAASDIYMPVSGKITALNIALEDEPELINQDAYGAGWLFKLAPENPIDIETLMSLTEYEESLNE